MITIFHERKSLKKRIQERKEYEMHLEMTHIIRRRRDIVDACKRLTWGFDKQEYEQVRKLIKDFREHNYVHIPVDREHEISYSLKNSWDLVRNKKRWESINGNNR